MRSLSSIIKGGRIRNQTVINLSEHFNIPQIEYESYESQSEDLGPCEPEQEQMNLVHAQVQALLDEAERKAEIILNNARQEAQEIRKNAELEKSHLLEETTNKQQLLLEQAREESRQIVQNAYDEKDQIISSIEGELAQTLLSLLQYLVGEEVYHNTAWILCLIKRMLAHNALKTDIQIYISADVYNRLTDQEKESLMHIKEGVTLHASETMNDTACRVQTHEGAIEYDVAEGLNQIISDIRILQNLKQETL